VLKESGQLGKIKVIGFDEDPITLGGVREGTIEGTVVQNPYEWGHQGYHHRDSKAYTGNCRSEVEWS
jgi:ABC-type sugar transport system substrate-binding protein